MKKFLLVPALACLAFGASAQTLTLTGTSYTQNFDGIGSGLPTGWRLYAASSATSIGALETLNTSATTGVFNDTACGANSVTSGGFKNYASANVCTEGTPCATQQAATNRALGVRQVSKTNATHPNLDSGAAFVLVLTNTTDINNVALQFKLQSLDTSSPRITKWMVDYAIGSPTSFTPIATTPSTLTTGGNTFSNTTVSVNFGTALDNKSSNVYIRITSLEVSTLFGNRASTAIDDFSLTWTGSVGVNNINTVSPLSLTQVGAATSSSVKFMYDAAEAGTYALSIFDMTGRKVYNEQLNAKVGLNNINVTNASLVPGMYVAKLANGSNSSVVKVVVE
jgi:trimeric autotransporter adhesin